MLSKRLKQARLFRKLTQEQLANLVNTKKATISNYENEHSTPSNEMLKDLADALNVSTDFLLGRTDTIDEVVSISKETNTYDPIDEINKLVKKYGIEQMGFFDIEEWKNLGPEDIELLEEQFKLIVRMAKQRNKNDKNVN